MSKQEKSYSSDWIQELEGRYNWDLYWHQLDLVINKSGLTLQDQVYEIGVGTGLTSGYLTRKGYKVSTIDIDAKKNPDIVADITNYDLPKAKCYLAYEVFEHIPLEEAKSIWLKLAEKGVEKLIISVPYAYKTYFWGSIWTPFFEEKFIRIGRKRNKINASHHFWELGFGGVTANTIVSSMKKVGYSVLVSYRYRSHHFFLFNLTREK